MQVAEFIAGISGAGAAGPVQLLFGTTYLPLGPRRASFAAKAQSESPTRAKRIHRVGH